MRIGMLAELHPDLNHNEICRLLIQAEQQGGLDLQRVCALDGVAVSRAMEAQH